MKGLDLNNIGEVQVYKGDSLTEPKEINGKTLLPYIPDPELKEAVNLAIFLQRPLLLMGDPGCGKTRLAEAVAFDLYGKDYKDYYFRWDVKSTSKAKDGLYLYHALRRLRDTQLGKKSQIEEEKGDKATEKEIIKNYISDGELGKALRKSTKEKPVILLIDEIDKADIDFPNDLLLELDENEFVIEETGKKFYTQYPPIIFITSNKEKELPAPFLRRCLFHHIEFPKKELLKKIIRGNFKKSAPKLVKKAVEVFLLIRKTMEAKFTEADKKVSTGELLDWYKMINHYYYNNLKINKKQKIYTALNEAIKQLHESGSGKIPFPQVLLKNWESHVSILASAEVR
jgi:MoxR-like ATPase